MRLLRTMAALGACGIAVAGAAACEPAAGGLDSAAVALTTDRTATSTLERLTFDVAWFSCTARARTGGAEATRDAAGTTAPAGPREVEVDCEGETGDGRAITLGGTVTEERAGVCVKGDMTARIAKKVVFQATMLGDCSAAATAERSRPARPSDPRPAPTVTVTETVTVTAVPAK
ncbi:hypothetical protein [Streptomyces sp. t39]|uniref:hypothetical protein n=1 Tax=Streptomyces sp. t39 TaxID=1828156 RepID=UPI0011CE4739|nr:hypothetical protein [Streptomyces sp. t39]TXS55099.1 hypothetical protein EAO77_01930 [Streptomyces sp. t39]